MLVTVTNRHTAELPICASIGILAGGASRTVDLTTAQLEEAKASLLALTSAGLITWSVAPSASSADDDLENVSRADLAAGVATASVTATGAVSGASVAATSGSSGVTVGTLKVLSGSADPEASVTAPAGSLYLRSNGTLYVKATGTGNTGWSAVATV